MSPRSDHKSTPSRGCAPEFFVGEKVALRPGADVSAAAASHPGPLVVIGYETFDGDDFVIVEIPATRERVAFTQYVTPGEIESLQIRRDR